MSKRRWLMGIALGSWLGALSCADDPPARPLLPPSTAGFGGNGGSPAAGSTFGGSLPIGLAGSDTGQAGRRFDFGASCDETRSIASFEPALIVRDPGILEAFSLERVLAQIAGSDANLTPLSLLQRLFDTQNTTASGVFTDNVHCDSADNPAFQLEPATYCPRAEGRLARSEGLLTPGDPDFFEPVALVNRFDLLPSDFATCGEYHLVFAKRSGRTDPEDRVLLSFDARLINASRAFARCRPVLEVWAGLEALDTRGQRDSLEQLFFNGVENLPPIIRAGSFDASGRCDSLGRCGQVRLAQGMQEPFEFRQFHAVARQSPGSPSIWFSPATSNHSLRPSLFDLAPENTNGTAFRDSLRSSVRKLAVHDVNRLSFPCSSTFEAGEVAVEGPASPNYRARLTTGTEAQLSRFDDDLLPALATVGEDCPTGDPLSPLALVERMAALSCAGCHAPDRVLNDDRRLGCGLVWPESLGVNHIDESGELSPALRDVFLPYRQRALTLFLRACDHEAAFEHLVEVPPPSLQ